MTREEYITRDLLNKIRGISESQREKGNITNGLYTLLSEEKSNKKLDAIAITNDAKFGNNALQSQIDEFRSSVDSSAQFSEPNNGKVSESPLIYIPSTGNIVFSGTIPCLNNLKFQFVLKTTTGNGCFVWSDGLILNKENLQILNKLYGFYCNWRDQWNSEAKDLDTLTNNMANN